MPFGYLLSIISKLSKDVWTLPKGKHCTDIGALFLFVCMSDKDMFLAPKLPNWPSESSVYCQVA